MKKNLLLSLLVLALGGVAGWLLVTRTTGGHTDNHTEPGHGSHDEHSAGTEARGSHGGRLFTEDEFTLELAIFERGVPPEFRAWAWRDGQPLPPEHLVLRVLLHRPGGVVDEHTLQPAGEFLRGPDEVYEPHSFDYEIEARYQDRTYRWELSAPEMQTTISAASAGHAGVVVETAGAATLPEILEVYGEVKRNADRVARAVPRFGGLVREARKLLGDTVTAGEIVANVESNDTLIVFDVRAPIAGVIIERSVTTGETVAEGAVLYVIADLSDAWIDLAVPRRELPRVRAGQTVQIRADDGGEPVEAAIATLLPLGAAESQSLIARVVVPTSDGRWRPGWFVQGKIEVARHEVSVAVKEDALQSVFDFTVVFSQHGELYQARPLELGRRGGGFIEVLKGLKAGERYVTENSFLIKADILKSGASHDH